MLSIGSRGPEVTALQQKLNGLGFDCGTADGIFGGRTQAAVVNFQRSKGLTPDGVVGPLTQAALAQGVTTAQAGMYLKAGARSANVAVVQAKLKAMGHDPGPVDGIFGNRTDSAVRAFQADKGILADGVVGPQTLGLLQAAHVKAVPQPVAPQSAPSGQVQVVNLPGNSFDQVPNRNETDFIAVHNQAGISKSVVDVHNMHLAKGWAGIGYQYWIGQLGGVFQGRPPESVGANIYGLNDRAVGICLTGNFDQDKPTEAQLAALDWLIPFLKGKYPAAKVIGHRDAVQYVSYATATSCPGGLFPLAEVKAKYN